MYTSKNLMVYNIYSSFNDISSNLYIVHLWKVVDGTLKKGSILRTILEIKNVAMEWPISRHDLGNIDFIMNH